MLPLLSLLLVDPAQRRPWPTWVWLRCSRRRSSVCSLAAASERTSAEPPTRSLVFHRGKCSRVGATHVPRLRVKEKWLIPPAAAVRWFASAMARGLFPWGFVRKPLYIQVSYTGKARSTNPPSLWPACCCDWTLSHTRYYHLTFIYIAHACVTNCWRLHRPES